MMILLTILAVIAIIALIMTTAPGNTGARLWDESTQGSDHTRMPGQPPRIDGGPEGVIYAPVGTLCCDETGNVYRKGTDATLNTGWCEMADMCNILDLFFGDQG